MARGSIGRRVARAAATGGGRTTRGRAPAAWYASLVLIVVLGTATVAFSRYERQHPPAPTPPTKSDHWYSALAFDICGKMQPNLPANTNQATVGLFTAGDGLIQIKPRNSNETGDNATLGLFVSEYKGVSTKKPLALSASSLRYPGGRTWANGDTCPATKDKSAKASAGKPGQVQVEVWDSLAAKTGKVLSGDPAGYKLGNGQLITIAFVPQGSKIPQPPSRLALLNASSASTTTTFPLAPTTTSQPTTTTAKSTTTTAKP